MAYELGKPVTITFEKLQQGTIDSESLVNAFGPDSLGIIVVSNLPEKFVPLRRRVLSYASHIGNLPQNELQELECPEAKYLVGWSCGKEKLANNKIDTLKGSYYINCAFYKDPKSDGAEGDYPDLPEYTKGNIWPREEILKGFKDDMQELCTIIIDTAQLVAREGALVHVEGYQEGYLEHVVKTSSTTKARLLHYFPPQEMGNGQVENEDELDNWCGMHRDHGCLTGLTSAMYVDELSQEISLKKGVVLEELPASPDSAAGLYIKSRVGKTVKIGIPPDCLAFQTGEALEIITEGKFKAVPHFVRGCRAVVAPGVSRNTLAVFTQPNLFDKVGKNSDFATFAREIVGRNTVNDM